MPPNDRERERPGLSLPDVEAVVASVRHPVLISDGDGNILWMNPAALNLHGFASVDDGRMPCREYAEMFELRAEGRLLPREERPLAQAMRGQVVRDRELHARRCDTGKSWVGLYSAERLPVTARTLFTVTIQDVTERKRIEEELRESQERLAMAIEAAGMGTWHAVPFGPLEGSTRLGEIYGLGAGSRIDDFESFMSHVHPDDREEHRRTVMKAIDPSGDGRFEAIYRWIRPDGGVRWVAAFGKTRFAEVGGVRRPVLGAGAVLDITDRKQAEEKLAAEKERLAAALAELHSMQAQLMQSDRLASVGMLAAGVAHEINNPLSYLVAALEVLAEETRTLEALLPAGRLRDVKEALAEAREGAARVKHVVRDLKTFSRGDEERRGRVDPRQVIESSLDMAFNEIKYRARVVKEYGPCPLVLANEARLGQVVLNLVVNAAHAIAEGHVDENEIRVATRTDERGRAVLEVRDTGSGIARELLGRIFDPFFTTKPTGLGTGLGLAICRNIVTALGGEILVESEVGAGSTFTLRLPPRKAQPARA